MFPSVYLFNQSHLFELYQQYNENVDSLIRCVEFSGLGERKDCVSVRILSHVSYAFSNNIISLSLCKPRHLRSAIFVSKFVEYGELRWPVIFIVNWVYQIGKYYILL